MNDSWLGPRTLARLCIALLLVEVAMGLINFGYTKADRLSNQGWVQRHHGGAIENEPPAPPEPESPNMALEVRRLVKYQFDLDREGNFVTWYSSMIEALVAVMAFAMFGTRRRLGWLVVGLGFLGLSMDEVAQVHEWVGIYAANDGFSFGHLTGPYPWAIILGPPILAFGAWVLWFLYRELVAHRRLRTVAVVSFLFFAAVIPLEYIGAKIQGDLPHPPRFAVILEECFEMFGATLVLYVLASLLRPGSKGDG